ncbi:MAG: hypothetical protein FD174_693 [Geobacteraceae bacterium]|nr:MAG: hypothetical protein FD174_693 [Geobacteraceae bacterium]
MIRNLCCLLFIITCVAACSRETGESRQVKAVIMRYNQLLVEGYKKLNMNPLQEVTTPEQATKLYYHMSALGEGKLRMDSTMKNIEFRKLEFRNNGEAVAETREIWDFTHLDMNSGKKFYEEKDFIYEMGYELKKEGGRWLITRVTALSGKSTNTTVPWPETKRHGGMSSVGNGRK